MAWATQAISKLVVPALGFGSGVLGGSCAYKWITMSVGPRICLNSRDSEAAIVS